MKTASLGSILACASLLLPLCSCRSESLEESRADAEPRTAAPAPSLRPGRLASHVMAYHGGLAQVVMFGGSDPERQPSNRLWGWDGKEWTLLSDSGPPARLHTGMAYDSVRDRLVVFGGIKSREESFSDVWEWDGVSWHLMETGSDGPGVRDHHALVYDLHSKSVLLFGGQSATDDYPGGTWSWDGQRWQRLTGDGPSPRSTHRLVHDSEAQRVLLYGGWGPDGLFGDLWEWRAGSWSELAGDHPTPRGANRIAYDQARETLVLFGGLVDRDAVGETWLLAEGAWRRFDGPGPAARNVHSMAFDVGRRRVVMYGGIDGDGNRRDDLWEWDGMQWHSVGEPESSGD